MLYQALLLASTLTVFLNLFLAYKVTVLEGDINKLRGDIDLKQQPKESTDGMITGMSRTWERSKRAASLKTQRRTEKDSQTLGSPTASSLRMKREQRRTEKDSQTLGSPTASSLRMKREQGGTEKDSQTLGSPTASSLRMKREQGGTEKDSQTLGSPTASSLRMKREQGGTVAQQSFLQLSANTEEQTFVRGNVTVIPWTVAVHQGEAISSTGDRIIVQQDGFFIVFGQVLFQSQGTIIGHIVRRRGTSQRSTELLRCLQEMPQTNYANTCYTGGIVKLEREDELELVIPDRPQAQVSMDADSTYFGIIQLN